MKSLLDRFDAVTVSESALISAEDLAFCEAVQQRFNQVLAKLQQEEKVLTEKVANEVTPYYGFDSDYNGRVTVQKSYDNRTLVFSKFEFTYKYALVAVIKLINELKLDFIHVIEKYFTDKYDLKYDTLYYEMYYNRSGSKYKEVNKYLTYQKILKYLHDECGGMSLTETAKRQAIERFKRTLDGGYRSSKAVYIKANTVELTNYFWFSSYDSTRKLDRDTYKGLSGVISIFETGEYQEEFIDGWLHESVILNTKYEADNCEKLVSIKVQLKKTVLTFIDPITAAQFCNQFEIETSLAT